MKASAVSPGITFILVPVVNKNIFGENLLGSYMIIIIKDNH